jgi:hypothetical protein
MTRESQPHASAVRASSHKWVGSLKASEQTNFIDGFLSGRRG